MMKLWQKVKSDLTSQVLMYPGEGQFLKGRLYNCPKEMVLLNHNPLPCGFPAQGGPEAAQQTSHFFFLKYCAYELSVHIFKLAVKKDFF